MKTDLSAATADQCDDREIVKAAVQESGLAIRHASERLRADREIVLQAVRQNGRALEFAADTLRADRQIAGSDRKMGYRAAVCVSALRDDHDVVLKAVRKWGVALKHASARLRSDRALVLVAVKRNARREIRFRRSPGRTRRHQRIRATAPVGNHHSRRGEHEKPL